MEYFLNKLQDKILITDYSGNILFCNKILLKQLKYQLNELDNIENLIVNSKISFNDMSLNCTEEYIVDILTKFNSTISFKINLSLNIFKNCDSIFIIFTDIDCDCLLSENLEESFKLCINTQKELSFLLKTATDITSIMSIDGSFIKVNDGWHNILGYTLKELLTKNWYDIIYEHDRAIIKFLINENMLSETILEACTRVKDKNHNIKWIHWSFSYIREENIIITTDIFFANIGKAPMNPFYIMIFIFNSCTCF